ncbi:MAG: 50S ribosomal protein L25 [Rhodothermales bacterium]
MDVITLEAQPREVGRKTARATRRAGNVPCILYGHRIEPVAFQVSEKSLNPLIYTQETHLITVNLDSNSWKCVVKDIAFHPITDRPMHADFQVLQEEEQVTLSVPVRYLGTAIGHTQGGRLSFMLHELEVSCLPKDIPSYIDVDITEVGIGDAIHVGELEIENVDIHAPADQVLMTVIKPRVVVEEVALDEEGEEGVEGEEAADEEEAGEEG